MLWQQGGRSKRVMFEAASWARDALHVHTERWLGGGGARDVQQQDAGSGRPLSQEEVEVEEELQPPGHMVPGTFKPRLSDASNIMTEHHISALCNSLPMRYRSKDWKLLYGTKVRLGTWIVKLPAVQSHASYCSVKCQKHRSVDNMVA